MAPFLLILLHMYLAADMPSGASGPCVCSNGRQRVEYVATVHSRDIKGSLDDGLENAERAAAVRALFSLSFCGDPPEGIKADKDNSLAWPLTGCVATKHGPVPWPELVEVICMEPAASVPLPAGIRLDSPVQWTEHGEELNRFWTASISLSRECPGRTHRPGRFPPKRR